MAYVRRGLLVQVAEHAVFDNELLHIFAFEQPGSHIVLNQQRETRYAKGDRRIHLVANVEILIHTPIVDA
jgi:hypothetical protein